MNNHEKVLLAQKLTELAADEATNEWSARLYIAAAVWLGAEADLPGDVGTAMTKACEQVKKRERGPKPSGFESCVRSWLEPEKYG